MKKLFILFALCLLFSCASTNSLSQERVAFYTDLVDEVNKECPIEIDELSILDEVVFSKKDNALVYVYTLLVEKESQTDVAWAAIKEAMVSNLEAQADVNANQPIYVLCRNDKLDIRHYFYDKNGKELFNVTQAYGSY